MASPERIYPSLSATVAMRRQRTAGTPALIDLYKILGTQINPRFASQMVERGFEVGGGNFAQQRSLKDLYTPNVGFTGNFIPGAALNFLCASGYLPLAVGVAPGVAVTTTLNGGVARHAKTIVLAANTGLVAGDWIQIGALATPGTPIKTDKSEIHEIAAILGAGQNCVQKVVIKATSGTFTATVGANTTAALPFNVSAAAFQSALEGLASVGSGNVTVTLSGETYTFTFASGKAATDMPLIEIDTTNLLLQQGTDVGPVPGRAWEWEVTPGAATGSIVLKGRMIQAFSTGAAVAKVDKTKYVTHYFVPVASDHPIMADYFSLYFKAANATSALEAIYYDAKNSSFAPNMASGQVATQTSELVAIDTTKNSNLLAVLSLLPDPTNAVVNNTRGRFNMLGSTVDAPRQVGFTVATEIYQDAVITQYKKQSADMLSRSVNFTSGGKLVKQFFDKITYGGQGTSFEEVIDAIPESSFQFRAESAKVINTSTEPYSFELNAPNAQFADYDPSLNTNQPVEAQMNMGKVVTDETTGEETHYWIAKNNCSSDVYSAA